MPSQCNATTGAACDDGVFCNGSDQCQDGSCSAHAGDPCSNGGECADQCDEIARTCITPAGSPCSTDGDPCTGDVCDGSGTCVHDFLGDVCTAAVTCATDFDHESDGIAASAEELVEFDLLASVAGVTIETGDGDGGCPAGMDTRIELYALDAEGTPSLLAGDNDSGADACSRISTNLLGKRYRVRVRGNAGAAVAPYVLSLSTDLCVGCGDGTRAPAEACDDGNGSYGDGCTRTCTVEECWSCSGSPSACSLADGATCDDGVFCNGADTCSQGACTAHAGEPCIDAPCIDRTCNEQADGCSQDVAAEGTPCDDADACTGGDRCDGDGVCDGLATHECGAACGDASLDYLEECDDGNTAGDDGCTGACTAFGNGSVAAAEDCDDGDFEFAPGQLCDGECRHVGCGMPTSPGAQRPRATDALFVLHGAVGSADCDGRVCDVDGDGNVDASDALRVLQAAVGNDVEFDCPESLPGTTTTTTTTTVTTTTLAAPPAARSRRLGARR
jgi:cysteine-rich repeat protein